MELSCSGLAQVHVKVETGPKTGAKKRVQLKQLTKDDGDEQQAKKTKKSAKDTADELFGDLSDDE